MIEAAERESNENVRDCYHILKFDTMSGDEVKYCVKLSGNIEVEEEMEREGDRPRNNVIYSR